MLVPLRQMLYPHYVGGYKDGFADYGTVGERFRPVGKEQRKAKRIIEKVAKTVLETPNIETESEIELILRLRLEQQGLIFKSLYLDWILKKTQAERKRKKVIALLLLN